MSLSAALHLAQFNLIITFVQLLIFLTLSKSCSIGMVLPLWSDTNIHLDGDG